MPLTEEQGELFLAARQAQLTRTEALQVIMSDAPHSVFYGAFVRVLLELQDCTEDYVIARIGAVTTGETYGGFSHNSSVRTDKYLLLVLPSALASINGTQYQLNSISNSLMTEAEFARWVEMMHTSVCIPRVPGGGERDYSKDLFSSNSVLPTKQELHDIGNRLHVTALGSVGGVGDYNNQMGYEHRRGRRGHIPQLRSEDLHHGEQAGVPVAAQGSNVQESRSTSSVFDANTLARRAPVSRRADSNRTLSRHQSSNNIHSVITPRGGNNSGSATFNPSGSLFRVNVSPRPPSTNGDQGQGSSAPDHELDLPSWHQIRQDVLNKLNQHSVVFPHNITELKLSQLRLAERDMIEYLEHVREAISSKQENCVVCMDHVPTVISLPCRHKVLCRLCASSVITCPVCRSQLFELFEPKEI